MFNFFPSSSHSVYSLPYSFLYMISFHTSPVPHYIISSFSYSEVGTVSVEGP